LLLIGTLHEILLIILTTVMGSVCLAVALAGYLYRPLSVPVRLGLVVSGLALLLPPNAGVPLGWVIIINMAGGVLAAALWLREFRARRVARFPVEAESQRA